MIDEAIEVERARPRQRKTKNKKTKNKNKNNTTQKQIVTMSMRSISEAVRREKNLRDLEVWPCDCVSLRVE